MSRCIPLVLAVVTLSSCPSGPPEYQLVSAVGGVVEIPKDEVADGRVHFFTFKHDGTNVNFLVRTDGNDALHAHFDACYSCYRYKRGYVVESGDLVCVACRYAYRIADEQWDYIGACAPISFHFAVDDSSLVIKRSVLEKGRRFF